MARIAAAAPRATLRSRVSSTSNPGPGGRTCQACACACVCASSNLLCVSSAAAAAAAAATACACNTSATCLPTAKAAAASCKSAANVTTERSPSGEWASPSTSSSVLREIRRDRSSLILPRSSPLSPPAGLRSLGPSPQPAIPSSRVPSSTSLLPLAISPGILESRCWPGWRVDFERTYLFRSREV